MEVLSKGVYGGHDYLPRVWDQWLQDKDRFTFVAVDGGEADAAAPGEAAGGAEQIVGLESALLLEGGKTVIFQALRVREDFQGKVGSGSADGCSAAGPPGGVRGLASAPPWHGRALSCRCVAS